MNWTTQDASQYFMPVGEALTLANRYRGEGRLMEAEALCRQALEAQPNLPEAAHLLGVIAHQNGKLGEAIEHVRRASSSPPRLRSFTPIWTRCCGCPDGPSSPPRRPGARSRSIPTCRRR
jgi:tetratricopeptide (TPR) repeat protein